MRKIPIRGQRYFPHLQTSYFARFSQFIFRNKKKGILIVFSGFCYFYRIELFENINKNWINFLSSINQKVNEVGGHSKRVLRDSIVETLKTKEVENGGVDYLLVLLKDKATIDQVIELLLHSIKSPQFIEEAKILGKGIVKDASIDKPVEDALTKMFARIFTTREIKEESKELVMHVLSQYEIKDQLIELIKMAFEEESVANAMRELLSRAFYQLLSKKETIEHMQVLLFNVLRSVEEKGDGSFSEMVIEKLVNESGLARKRDDSSINLPGMEETESLGLESMFNKALKTRYDKDGKPHFYI